MAPPSVQTCKEIYLLPLTDLGAPDVPGGYIYLPPPTDTTYTLRFAIEGTSSICRHGSLWINIPAPGGNFERSIYKEYKLRPDFNKTIEIDIPITIPGPFSYYVTYTPLPDFTSHGTVAPDPMQTETYYVDVAPNVTLSGASLPFDALSVFSILPKFMGKYPDSWEKHLHGIGQRGYNMVHFTPLQQRGESNSPYSIFDQLKFEPGHFPRGEKDIVELVEMMEHEHGLLGMTDVVLNHTANNSLWLQEHPEAGYNVETAPWLESALELDTALLNFSDDLESLGLPTDIKSIDDLVKISDGMKTHVIGKLQLWQYYVVDVEHDTKEAVAAWKAGQVDIPDGGFGGSGVGGLEGVRDWPLKRKAEFLLEKGFTGRDQLGPRYWRKIDPKVGAALLTVLHGRYDSVDHGAPSAGAVANTMQRILDELNLEFYREYDKDVAEILDQVSNRAKYVRLDEHGPKSGPITKESRLIESYFTWLPVNATTKMHSEKSLALVNNGWIWAANAMVDHAGPNSKAYLRREVIVWGDCVKLRYGDSPEDSPFLWEHMAKYTRLTAKYFSGFRIDNCHSTPIHVAEYMLDEARKVRPNLIVFAELFTGSEETDFTFVKRLGLSALIREAMQAWSTGELSRLVHRHGGRPIGSFEIDEITKTDKKTLPDGSSPRSPSFTTTKEKIRRIKQNPVHALFMDCTHDNELPAQKRDARDTLPNSALVNMCACATGSVMGYDEIYPNLIEMVTETRKYTSVYSEKEVKVGGGEGGIGGVKKLLNQIHVMMGKDAYDETHIHHEGELITVHRVHPRSRKGFFMIAHTAFPGYGNGNGGLAPVHLTGTKAKLLGSWMLEVDNSEQTRKDVEADKELLRGLPSKVIELRGLSIELQGDDTVITVPAKFPPGSIAVFETWIPSAEHSEGLDKFVTSGAADAFGQLTLVDLNFLLYRCDAEERDQSGGADGVYAIPKIGPLVYAGLQGWWSVLRDVIRNNDLGHPICDHLREGQWSLDYIVGRLDKLVQRDGYNGLGKPTQWLRERFEAIRKIPSFLLPRYFALVIQTAYNAAWDRGTELMSDDIKNGQKFLQQLAMVSVQQTGYVKSTSLWPTKQIACLAAGLPHFATDWARCWGRDVFISTRGLFLATGRIDDALEHIKAFASVLKHGMIPNLLSAGRGPRYNSRDSVWFFLQNIQDYTKMVPNGLSILEERIPRRFLPYDDTYFDHDDPRAYSKSSTIEEIIQEALQRHATGMSFRESNAGANLDMQMKPAGFQIDIKVDWETGIIFGGNQDNCGTWMDKMGESQRANSKGVPGTPRDGAAVEITGLAYSTLKWVAKLNKEGKYSSSSVDLSDGKTISFADWAAKIKANFERCYYVPNDQSHDRDYDIDRKMVNRRGIYKDLYRSGKPYEDYQLRCNFPIAMVVAPDLFDPVHALGALEMADKILRGPTGMATLDPRDLNYRPYYNNSEDSEDFATSKGRNYHQGPEWLWPTGFFLRALLKFDLMRRKSSAERTEAFQQITRRLAGCKKAIEESPWAGLTELTQKNGEYCADSSPTQAWSAGCLIDLFHDAKELAA